MLTATKTRIKTRPHRLHVNVNMMRFNATTGSDEPCLVAIPGTGGPQVEAHEILLKLPDGTVVAKLVNRPNDRTPSGAQAYIETCLAVECDTVALLPICQ